MPGVSVLSYLRYLHDVNRKLLQRGGLENVLYRRTARQSAFYHQFDQPDPTRPTHWLKTRGYLRDAEARGVALRPLLGFGLVVGMVETWRGMKRLSGPLAFCNCLLMEDEEHPDVTEFEPLWDTITLNYDLLTLLLGQEETDEEDDGDAADLPLQQGIGKDILAVFTRAEQDLERVANDLNPEGRLKGAELSRMMNDIRNSVPAVKSLTVSSAPYEHRKLDDLVKQRPPVFFAHRFFFVAPAAGQLTTMTALAELIRQSERRSQNAV